MLPPLIPCLSLLDSLYTSIATCHLWESSHQILVVIATSWFSSSPVISTPRFDQWCSQYIALSLTVFFNFLQYTLEEVRFILWKPYFFPQGPVHVFPGFVGVVQLWEQIIVPYTSSTTLSFFFFSFIFVVEMELRSRTISIFYSKMLHPGLYNFSWTSHILYLKHDVLVSILVLIYHGEAFFTGMTPMKI